MTGIVINSVCKARIMENAAVSDFPEPSYLEF